jgi:hypothetical protein
VCNCPKRAGGFRHDVADGTNISSDNIEMEPLDWNLDNGHWFCPTCKTIVARRFSDDHWQVRTKRGWIE